MLGYGAEEISDVLKVWTDIVHADDLQITEERLQLSADLARQLLAFARKQTIAPKVIDLNDTVTGMLKMLQRLIGSACSGSRPEGFTCDIGCLFMSGYTAAVIAPHGVLGQSVNFTQKPFSLFGLAKKVREVLDS